MVAGRDVCICDDCVASCTALLDEEANGPVAFSSQPIPTPRRIRRAFDRYVVGQERAKKVLAVAVHNHYKRTRAAPNAGVETELPRSHVLLIGPSGCGKTLLARTLAATMRLPLAIADATSVTEAGYVGGDVDSVLARLLIEATFDVGLAERGILYLDEVDKLGRRELASGGKDIGGEGVQESLLAMLDGKRVAVAPFGGRGHPQQRVTHVDTSHILFVCAGSFAGLDDIIERRLAERRVGFCAGQDRRPERSPWERLQRVEPEDLIEFGLLPELVGRLAVIAPMHELSPAALHEVLTRPRNALVKQYRRLFAIDGIDLEFTDGALSRVVELTRASSSGARSLRAVLECAMLDIMFEAPSDPTCSKVIVDERIIDRYCAREAEEIG